MNVKIKRIDKNLPLPEYQTKGAVAFDLVTREKTTILPKSTGKVPSNIIVAIPSGYLLFIKDRSSTAKKKGLLITAGIIDQDYCGEDDEILVQFYNPGNEKVIIKRGERVAQGIFIKINTASWQEVDKMSKSSRGGFGTTD